MNRLMTFRRGAPVVQRQQKLNQAILQGQAVARFQEKKGLFSRSISCVSRLYKKVTDFFSGLWIHRTSYSGPLNEGMPVSYRVNPKNHGGVNELSGTILSFIGTKKAKIDEGDGKIVRRSINRLIPVPVAA